jgi:hypothetical protein
MILFKTVTKDSSVAALLRNDKWECLHLFVSASPFCLYRSPFTDHCIAISYRHLITILPFLLVQNNWGYSQSLPQILAFLETYILNNKAQLQGLQGINTENIFPLDGSYRFKQGVIKNWHFGCYPGLRVRNPHMGRFEHRL